MPLFRGLARKRVQLAIACLAAVVGLPAGTALARSPAPSHGYIVVYKQSVRDVTGETVKRERSDGFETKFRYRHAVKGFAANLSPGQVRKLRRDPDVAFVSPDRTVHALATAPLASGETAPTGVRRMEAVGGGLARAGSSANVAVIDTGIDLGHADLNAVSGTNCVSPGDPAQDDNGHGTHVAGTIGAKNTGSGVVGVSPGTKIYAAKVLDASGGGTDAEVICGIDWVTGTRSDGDPSNDVAVVNMSLGGLGDPLDSCPTTADPMHKAICDSTAAGVTYVVAAGNEGWDYDYAPVPDVPAAYPEALTVTAVSDSDGKPGIAGGAPTCRTGEADDKYASFSNYALTTGGKSHTIAAPGVCIYSSWLGGYNTISGTSMATPHMTGAVALCLNDGGVAGPCAGLTPAQIVQKMRSDASGHSLSVFGYGFTGDPLRPVSSRYYGYLDWAGTTPPPTLTHVTKFPGTTTITSGTLRGGSAASLTADDNVYYSVNSTTASTRTSAWYGTFSGVSKQLTNLKVLYRGQNSLPCTQTLALWDWTANGGAGAWVQFDSRSVSNTELPIGVVPLGSLAKYVGGTTADQLRYRVRCTRSSSSFYSVGELLKIEYDKP